MCARIPICPIPLSFISLLTSDTILHSAIQKHNLTSLKILFSGAAPLGAELVLTVMKRMKGIGADVDILQGVFSSLDSLPESAESQIFA
jgi:hypothetical protein